MLAGAWDMKAWRSGVCSPSLLSDTDVFVTHDQFISGQAEAISSLAEPVNFGLYAGGNSIAQ
jgi:hypothetical protein